MRTATLALLACLSAAAADVSGTWQTSFTNSEGQLRQSTLTLRQSSGALAGEFVSARGKAPLSTGSVLGSKIAFTVVRKGNGDEIPIRFTGAVSGDTMKLHMRIRGRPPIRMTARRER